MKSDVDDRNQADLGQEPGQEATGSALRADSLAHGVVLLLTLTVAQRLIGFLRGVLSCRWLAPEELGTWDLANGFLVLVAPLVVLGVPGSFGRYVEHYRQRGQLRKLLRQTIGVSAILTVVGTAALLAGRTWVGWLVCEGEQRVRLVVLLSLSLAAVIAFNFLVELFTALRQTRVVARMQFVNSALFAGIGLTLISWNPAAESLVVAYGIACLVTALGAAVGLVRLWSHIPENPEPLPAGNLWLKLVPFAAWVWMTNLLCNLFEVADRYMILHLSGLEPTAAASLVGNYHCSRVLPVLLVAVAGLLANLILPHLSSDWEGGNRAGVRRRMNLIVKLTGLGLFTAGVALTILSPVLFGWAFGGKYDGGRDVFPWTLTYCVWVGMTLVAQLYLWCAERTSLTSLVYLLGLLVNVALNLLLVPLWGLPGAVLATAVGNAVAIALMYAASALCQMQWDRRVWAITALPLALAGGAVVAALALAGVVLAAVLGQLIFTNDEKERLKSALWPYWQRGTATMRAWRGGTAWRPHSARG